MSRRLVLLLVPLMAFMVACGTVAEPKPKGPLDIKPTAEAVLEMSPEFAFEFMPGEAIANVEWDVEIDYDTRDVDAVFDYYDAELVALGFTRTSIERDDDDIEAEYVNGDGIEIDLDVELDDGNVEVDLDIDDFTGPYPTGFSLTSFAGITIPIFHSVAPLDVEWDFNFDHPSTDVAAAFAYYDGHLQDLGWTQTEIDDGDDDEMEAEYVKDGVHLELEVDDDTEVELEFNKLRFY